MNPITNGKQELPLLKCRGSHYEVGFLIGTTFKVMIQDLLKEWKYFNNVVLKAGKTPAGEKLIENSLRLCCKRFPGYVNEIRGMAEGAEIEFEKLFMLNIDSILCTIHQAQEKDKEGWSNTGGTGCTTIICNKDEVILGHTEDAMAEVDQHIYIVSAEILDDTGTHVLEKFTTLCYAGTLMGYTMGFNDEMIYSVNTIFPIVCTTGTPRSFIARALLGATGLKSLVDILKDSGNGISDGISVNVNFYHKNEKSDNSEAKSTSFYNIEAAPPGNNEKESIIDIFEVKAGSCYSHCNKYLRIQTSECNRIAVKYSDRRNDAICRHEEPCCDQHVRKILSDQSDHNYPIFNNGGNKGEPYDMNFIRTVATGIFDIHKKTWSLYTNASVTGKPVHIFYLG